MIDMFFKALLMVMICAGLISLAMTFERDRMVMRIPLLTTAIFGILTAAIMLMVVYATANGLLPAEGASQ